MKVLKHLGILLLFVLVITFILSLILSTSQKIERTITIHAPATVIYNQLSKLENFNRITVWNQRDSLVKHIISGNDGTLGATNLWHGDPEISGEGKITIAALEPGKMIRHDIHFTAPRKSEATSTFTLNEVNNSTTVTWIFRKATPRPWNIFNLLYNLDKEMGPDFEEGLSLLKKNTEPQQAITEVKTTAVRTINFPATSYALVRQLIKWNDIHAFLSLHKQVIRDETGKNNEPGVVSAALIFSSDEKLRETDMAAAIPVNAGTTMEHGMIRMLDIPASKAVYTDHYGPYAGTRELYPLLRKYLSENKLKERAPIIEQYITDPGKETDTSRWLTRIIFLVE